MMRSLYSAISGLKNHQVKMDVIGNNIANVNTTGFKRSRVSFATTLSQTLKGASSPTASLGGTNSMQVGMGAMLGSIDQVMTKGSSQSTGNATDMLIQGPGFFVLDNNGTVYSRAGTFGLDSAGNLIDPGTGAKVQGAMYTAAGVTNPATITTDVSPIPPLPPIQPALVPIQIVIGSQLYLPGTPATATGAALDSYSIDQKGVITGVYITPANATTGTAAVSQNAQIGQIAIATFANDAGLDNVGSNFYRETSNSGIANSGAAGSTGHGSVVPGAVEMSNVDLSTEFTDMIVAQRGFQANSRVITVSDSLLQELIDLKRN
ncbi:MAG TPA: flagellar hook-basal body complex protein [Desulfosporosinus sp.]|nr:flagellar hook-basal body complex protein [Desulfosporosinus sp.]